MFKKVFLTFSTSILIALITLLTATFLSKNFGSNGYGEIGIFLFFVNICVLLTAVCGSSALVYVLPKNNYQAVFWLTSTWSLIIPLIFVACSALFGMMKSHFLWLFIIGVSQSLYINYLYLIFADSKIRLYNFIRTTPPLILITGIGIGWMINQLSLQLYFFSLFLAYIIPSIFLLFTIYKRLLGWNFNLKDFKHAFNHFLSFGGLGQVTNLIQMLNYRLCYFFILHCCGKTDVGVMTLALTFVDGIWLFKNSASTLRYLDATKEDKEMDFNSRDSMNLVSFLVTLLIVAGVLIVPNKFYEIIFSKDFVSLKQLILLMSPGILIMSLSSITANYFSGKGKVFVNFYAAVLGFLVFLPSIYLFTNKYGLKGAAIANNFPLVIGSLVVYHFYVKYKSDLS